MSIAEAQQEQPWEDFLAAQTFCPFLQSWTMGEVYNDIGLRSIRLENKIGNDIQGICQATLVPARRGRHLAVSYGPIVQNASVAQQFVDALIEKAKELHCSFVRLSPFVPEEESLRFANHQSAPLHLLAENIWYLPLQEPNPWTHQGERTPRTEEEIFMSLRKTTRNLVRRAEREGVEVTASDNPQQDIEHFITLHEETRKRHHFTPYSNAFFRAQLERFSEKKQCTLYLARYQGEVLASSMHMHLYGETSYHHGASTHAHPKIPASYLLQWTAIKDAIARKDRVYNFWGIAPSNADKHPFKGVTTFKTGFGGSLLNIQHCVDVPISTRYHLTRAFETVRKWRRGF